MSSQIKPGPGSGPKKGLVSLYADLLDPGKSSSEMSRTSALASNTTNSNDCSDTHPSIEQKSAEDTSKQIDSRALRFQPVPRRPQPVQGKFGKRDTKKPTAKAPLKLPKFDLGSDQSSRSLVPNTISARVPLVKSSLEDWAGNEDVYDPGNTLAANPRQRGGRKRKRKQNDLVSGSIVCNWDGIYDPSRPNLYEEYKESDEKEQELQEWRDRLYGTRRVFSHDEDSNSDVDTDHLHKMSFAPPTFALRAPISSKPTRIADQMSSFGDIDLEETPDTKYDNTNQPSSTSYPPQELAMLEQNSFSDAPAAQIEAIKSQDVVSEQNRQEGAIISRAPLIYEGVQSGRTAAKDTDGVVSPAREPDTEQDVGSASEEGRSLRPGQKGFAERLMSRYGWTKGTGLGASSSGIVHALEVKRMKHKSGRGMGDILDQNTNSIIKEDALGFGKMSEVIVLHNMVDGLEEDDSGILMQEIGDECSEQYGRIERVQILHRASHETHSRVFVQFTSQLSALRAVNALDGRVFNGNVIQAKFFDTEKFARRDFN